MMVLTQEYSRIAALPHSRNHLRHVPFEKLYVPLQKAFSLLEITHKYKKMSLEEIHAKLGDNETLIEDGTGWTAEELIQQLNQLLG